MQKKPNEINEYLSKRIILEKHKYLSYKELASVHISLIDHPLLVFYFEMNTINTHQSRLDPLRVSPIIFQ